MEPADKSDGIIEGQVSDLRGQQLKNKHLIGLDVFRFCAAIAVMVYHLGALYLRDPSRVYLSEIIDVHSIEWLSLSWAKYGWIGVQIFFVISGIVIAASIDGKSASAYVRSRVLRLYPGVWVCTAISMLCIIASHQVESSQWFSLWIRSSVIFPLAPWVDGAYWTLPVEITFYGVMLACIGRSARASVFAAIGLICLSALFWGLYVYAPEQSKVGKLIGKAAGSMRFDVGFVQNAIYFGIGILINRSRTLIARLCVLLVCAPICFLQITRVSEHAGEYLSVPTVGWIPFVVWVSSILLIIASIEWNDSLHSFFSASVVRIVRRAGLATYPLYLLHVTVGFAVIYACAYAGFGTWLSWAIGLIVPIFGAVWVADVLEPKVRRMTESAIDRVIGSRTNPSSA